MLALRNRSHRMTVSSSKAEIQGGKVGSSRGPNLPQIQKPISGGPQRTPEDPGAKIFRPYPDEETSEATFECSTTTGTREGAPSLDTETCQRRKIRNPSWGNFHSQL